MANDDSRLRPGDLSQGPFTLLRQTNQLVAAQEADPALGFMARLMTLCSLPRTNPGTRKEYVRRNGPFALFMNATAGANLPYGNLPRLLLAWMCTEAVRTQSPDLVLGRSLSEFMKKLGMAPAGAGRTRLRNQMTRLFSAVVSLVYTDDGGEVSMGSRVTSRAALWWDPKRPDEPALWESTVRLGAELFEEIINHPVPIEMRTLKALRRSPLGLDLYLWLTYRVFTLKEPVRLSWKLLYQQFGANPDKANDRFVVRDFRKKCLRELAKIKMAWPELNYSTAKGVLILSPSKTLISAKQEEK